MVLDLRLNLLDRLPEKVGGFLCRHHIVDDAAIPLGGTAPIVLLIETSVHRPSHVPHTFVDYYFRALNLACKRCPRSADYLKADLEPEQFAKGAEVAVHSRLQTTEA